MSFAVLGLVCGLLQDGTRPRAVWRFRCPWCRRCWFSRWIAVALARLAEALAPRLRLAGTGRLHRPGGEETTHNAHHPTPGACRQPVRPLAAAPALAQTQITIQHALPLVTSHYGAGADAFRQTFERLTNGRYRVVMQRNDNEREMIESVQIGHRWIAPSPPPGRSAISCPRCGCWTPFLFRDYAHARGVLDSAIGQELLQRFAPRGLVGVVWMENGFRHLTNNRREVRTPADVQGLKVRTMENQVHMRAFSTLGALPTPMAFSELVPALQYRGTVTGRRTWIPVIVANNSNQVQRFLTLTATSSPRQS